MGLLSRVAFDIIDRRRYREFSIAAGREMSGNDGQAGRKPVFARQAARRLPLPPFLSISTGISI